jgi:hypothetical protein
MYLILLDISVIFVVVVVLGESVLFSCGVIEEVGLICGTTEVGYGTFFLNEPGSGLLVISIRLVEDLLLLSK